MGFRSDDEALRSRVDALEGDLAERDEEVARLKAELEAARTPPPPPAAPPLKVSFRLWERLRAAPSDPTPEGDVWALPVMTPSPWVNVLLVAWAAAAFVGPLALARSGEPDAGNAWIPMVIFGVPPLLLLLYRRGVVIDRRARTVTTWRWFLLRWSRTLPLDGQKIVIQRRLVQPKEGDSYWVGRILLGDHFLVMRREKPAELLAKRVAAFTGLPFAGTKGESAKQMERQAMMPLLITGGLVGLGLLGYFAWSLVAGP